MILEESAGYHHLPLDGTGGGQALVCVPGNQAQGAANPMKTLRNYRHAKFRDRHDPKYPISKLLPLFPIRHSQYPLSSYSSYDSDNDSADFVKRLARVLGCRKTFYSLRNVC
jgi:hypothetical protein